MSNARPKTKVDEQVENIKSYIKNLERSRDRLDEVAIKQARSAHSAKRTEWAKEKEKYTYDINTANKLLEDLQKVSSADAKKQFFIDNAETINSMRDLHLKSQIKEIEKLIADSMQENASPKTQKKVTFHPSVEVHQQLIKQKSSEQNQQTIQDQAERNKQKPARGASEIGSFDQLPLNMSPAEIRAYVDTYKRTGVLPKIKEPMTLNLDNLNPQHDAKNQTSARRRFSFFARVKRGVITGFKKGKGIVKVSGSMLRHKFSHGREMLKRIKNNENTIKPRSMKA